jgi:uncharacterized membrane protein YkvA (DUF1232 family)
MFHRSLSDPPHTQAGNREVPMATLQQHHSERNQIPWRATSEPGRRKRVGDWTLCEEEVAKFDALVQDVHPGAPRVDADHVAQVARWLLAMPEERAAAMLAERLARIDELRRMVADADWDCADRERVNVQKMLAYLDQEETLIPDRTPTLGKLDDLLLLELTWPALAREVDEYQDFCRYRDSEHPVGSGAQQRATWIRERLAALALVQHQQRVSGSHYAIAGLPSEPFRIGG